MGGLRLIGEAHLRFIYFFGGPFFYPLLHIIPVHCSIFLWGFVFFCLHAPTCLFRFFLDPTRAACFKKNAYFSRFWSS